MNKNVGRSTVSDAGLIIQARPELDTNEAGLIQTKLIFNLRNGKFADLNPPRGTACPDFIAGDDITTAVLAEFPYLAAQTSKMVRDAIAPGIGQLEVDCQGAILTQAGNTITPPFVTVGNVKDTAQFPVFNDSTIGSLLGQVTIDYRAIELTFEYVAGEFAQLPRFISPTYQMDGDGNILIYTPVGNVGLHLNIDSIRFKTQSVDSNGSVIDGPDIASTVSINDFIPGADGGASFRDKIQFVGDASQFIQSTAGLHWLVKETVTIKILPIVSAS